MPPTRCRSEFDTAPAHEFGAFTKLKVAFVQMAYQLPGVFANPADAYAQASSGEQRQSESWLRRTYPVSLLRFAPDFVLFDPLLGSFVDQSNLFCQSLPADKKELCAFYYSQRKLGCPVDNEQLHGRCRPGLRSDSSTSVGAIYPRRLLHRPSQRRSRQRRRLRRARDRSFSRPSTSGAGRQHVRALG